MLAGLGLVVAAYAAWLSGGQSFLALRISDIASMVALIGVMGGLVGLRRARRQGTRSYGRLGTTGFAVALAGNTLALIGIVLVFLVGSGVLGGGLAARVLVMGNGGAVLGIALLGVGLVLLGVAALRAKALPRWAGVVLVGAFPASAAVGVFLSIYSGLIGFGCAWLTLSYALWSERDEASLPETRPSAEASAGDV